MIYLWTADESAVDKFHANNHRLYQVMAHIKLPDGIHTQESTPYLLGRSLAKEMPEVEVTASFQEGYAKGALSAGDKQVVTRRCFADANFLNLFSYKLVAGNKSSALNDKYSVLLSEKLITRRS